MHTGKNLKRLRLLMGWTQDAFGKIICINRTTLSEIENNRLPVSEVERLLIKDSRVTRSLEVVEKCRQEVRAIWHKVSS